MLFVSAWGRMRPRPRDDFIALICRGDGAQPNHQQEQQICPLISACDLWRKDLAADGGGGWAWTGRERIDPLNRDPVSLPRPR